MLALLISILLSLGLISSEHEFHQMDPETQQYYQENTIVEELEQF